MSCGNDEGGECQWQTVYIDGLCDERKAFAGVGAVSAADIDAEVHNQSYMSSVDTGSDGSDRTEDRKDTVCVSKDVSDTRLAIKRWLGKQTKKGNVSQNLHFEVEEDGDQRFFIAACGEDVYT